MPKDNLEEKIQLSLLTMPPEEQKVPIDGKKFHLKYQGAADPPVIPILINPEHEGVDVNKFPKFSHMGKAAIDHDGSPTAYMPGDKGSDYLENGFDSTGYYGFDPNILNSEGGYLSRTRWQKGDSNRQESFIDARKVPYVVVPNDYFKTGGKNGDFVKLHNKVTGKEIWAVVADSRGRVKEVEVSIAAAKQLGIEFNRSGATKNYQKLTMQAFKGSASGRWYQ